jgi:hypothetical protein
MFAGEKQLSHIRKEHTNTAATSCSNGRQSVLSMKGALVIKRECRVSCTYQMGERQQETERE